MVHIAFGEAMSSLLKRALGERERVLSFFDIFSIGPIYQLHEESGRQARYNWLRHMMNEYSEADECERNFLKMTDRIRAIRPGEFVTIWTAENAHEQAGMRYVVHLLNDRSNDIGVVNTTRIYNKLFTGHVRPNRILHSGEIPFAKLQLIDETRDEPPLNDHERERLEQEWHDLAESSELLRIWRNGTIQSAPEEYYDYFLIKRVKQAPGGEFIEAAHIVGDVLGHLNQCVGADFLQYRLRQLVEQGVLETDDSLAYSIRLRV